MALSTRCAALFTSIRPLSRVCCNLIDPHPTVLLSPQLYKIGAAEGIRGLQRGLPAACLWQFSNVGTRFGVYGLTKKHLDVENSATNFRWLKSMGLAGCSGLLAAMVSNPFFMIKTRFQGASKLDRSDPHLRSLFSALLQIGREDGWRGYFRGLTAFAPRVMVASGVQLSTYDEVKVGLKSQVGLVEGFALHVVASWITGVAVVGTMQPFDFAATRMMNEAGQNAKYRGLVDCLVQSTLKEGFLSVYKGVVPNYLRFGPYCILVFVFLEQLKKINP